MKVLITGGAGFIGAHLAKRLLAEGEEVVMVDDFNSFLYAGELKHARLAATFEEGAKPRVIVGSILDGDLLDKLFTDEKFDKVVHLAAHPNPGYSVGRAEEYTIVNVMGTLTVLEMCRKHDVVQMIFAGSSSVYNDEQTPFKEDAYPLKPRSPYGASKASGELYCQMWHDVYGLPITILRFFSVYGPWGRPDMAPFIFAQQLLDDEPIGLTADRKRDFTYISDIVDGIVLALEARFDFEIINLGRGDPVDLQEFVAALEKAAGKTAKIVDRPAPPGELIVTYANIEKAKKLLGYEPKVSVAEGAKHLVEWLKTWQG